MRNSRIRSCAAAGMAILAAPVLAASTEETLEITTRLIGVVFLLFVIAVIAGVYFARLQDERRTRLDSLYAPGDPVHSVAPDATVSECVRLMAARRIGALVVLDGSVLAGIFSERDAVNRVLAAGLDPARTAVSAVMTRNPSCLPPTATVGEAMELVTQRRFRHLPVVQDGRLLAVVSSGDLTRWLVKEKLDRPGDILAGAPASTCMRAC